MKSRVKPMLRPIRPTGRYLRSNDCVAVPEWSPCAYMYHLPLEERIARIGEIATSAGTRPVREAPQLAHRVPKRRRAMDRRKLTRVTQSVVPLALSTSSRALLPLCLAKSNAVAPNICPNSHWSE